MIGTFRSKIYLGDEQSKNGEGFRVVVLIVKDRAEAVRLFPERRVLRYLPSLPASQSVKVVLEK